MDVRGEVGGGGEEGVEGEWLFLAWTLNPVRKEIMKYHITHMWHGTHTSLHVVNCSQ